MIRPLLLALVASGCAVGSRSYDSTLTPVQHRAVRALVGATITLGAEDVGIRPSIALVIGTVGQVAATKALTYARHPDRLGPWSPGDVACDLVWSGAVAPFWLWRHHGAKAGVVGAAGWLAAAVAVSRSCVP